MGKTVNIRNVARFASTLYGYFHIYR